VADFFHYSNHPSGCEALFFVKRSIRERPSTVRLEWR